MATRSGSRPIDSGGKRRKSEPGTRLAIYNSFKSVAASSAEAGDNTPRKQRRADRVAPDNTGGEQARSTWGGARLQASRTSDCLSIDQAAGIIAAAQCAAAIGLPFNRHITIHWELAGVPDRGAAAATGRFLKLAADWVATRSSKFEKQSNESKQMKAPSRRFACAWVRENGERKGSHLHILCHVPAGAELGRMQKRWLRRITGRPYQAGSICTRRIGGTARAAETAPAVYQANLEIIVGYVLKGASSEAAQRLRLEELKPQGRVIGKRAGWSQSVGRAAQARSLK